MENMNKNDFKGFSGNDLAMLAVKMPLMPQLYREHFRGCGPIERVTVDIIPVSALRSEWVWEDEMVKEIKSTGHTYCYKFNVVMDSSG